MNQDVDSKWIRLVTRRVHFGPTRPKLLRDQQKQLLRTTDEAFGTQHQLVPNAEVTLFLHDTNLQKEAYTACKAVDAIAKPLAAVANVHNTGHIRLTSRTTFASLIIPADPK